MKNILIFGATGNIGVYLTDYCKERFDPKEFHIIAIGTKKTKLFEKLGIEYINVDVTNKEDFLKLPTKDVFAIVNLAGILPAYLQDFEPSKYLNVNVIGAINVMEYARKTKADRVLYTQTWSDLGGYWGKEEVLSSDMPRKLLFKGDHAFYSITKSMIVDTLEFYNQEYGIKNYVFRLPNIYLYNPQRYYYVDGVKKYIGYRYMIDRAIAGDDIEVWGDPKAFKDIIYVKDLCQMMYLALTKLNAKTGIYNAGTGVKTTLDEQIKTMVEVFSPKNKKSKLIYKPEKSSFTSFVMDIEKAKKELGYEPKYFYKDYLEDYKKEMELKRFDELWESK